MQTIIFVLIFYFFSFGQNEVKSGNRIEYNMKVYFIGIVLKGDAWTPEETPEIEELQKNHLNYIAQMLNDGKLIVAGPFVEKDEKRGILLFNTETFEEAVELANNDPAVKVGRLKIDVLKWYAADGIMLDLEKAIKK